MKRIAQIDGLRAIAILLVLSFHFINNQLEQTTLPIGKILYKVTSFGWSGVDLFFVLSGFLIGGILIANKEKKRYFSTFFIRRFVRIVPSYYLLLVIYIILIQIPIFKNYYFFTRFNDIPMWSYFALLHNIYMANLHSMGNVALSITWSIGIEEQFYILVPFIIYFIQKKYLHYLLILIIILANIFRLNYPATNQEVFSIAGYVLLPCRMDAIAFGVLLAWINDRYGLPYFVKKYYSFIIASMIGILFLCVVLILKFHTIGVIRNTFFALFFSCCIAIALGKPTSIYGNLLSKKWLGWIGKISYSLYLFHYLIIGVCCAIAQQYFNFSSYNVQFITLFLAFMFSFFFAWVVYKFMETPIVNLGKKVTY